MVVGWSIKPTLAREIVVDALMMAVWRRKPKSKVLIHSDQGSQYGSDDWLRFCRANKLEPSVSRRGNCWDNAVAESFFSSLKKERVKKRIYKTRDLARADIFDYIKMFYNQSIIIMKKNNSLFVKNEIIKVFVFDVSLSKKSFKPLSP